MSRLDCLYLELLRLGLILLRDAICSKNEEWSRHEVEYLHEVPGLIGESNLAHHCGFWDTIHSSYKEWVNTLDENLQEEILTFYEPVWREMEPLMLQIKHQFEQIKNAGPKPT